jgi:uncharacterized membrane protein
MSSYDAWLFEPYEKYYNECEEEQRREEEILGELEDITDPKEKEEYLRNEYGIEEEERLRYFLGGGS